MKNEYHEGPKAAERFQDLGVVQFEIHRPQKAN